jgi:hypothetical protein
MPTVTAVNVQAEELQEEALVIGIISRRKRSSGGSGFWAEGNGSEKNYGVHQSNYKNYFSCTGQFCVFGLSCSRCHPGEYDRGFPC